MAAELRDYQTLSALGVPIPRLLEADREQERLLKELIPGQTIYQLVLRDSVEPLPPAQQAQDGVFGSIQREAVHRGLAAGAGAGAVPVPAGGGVEHRLVPHQFHVP